MVCRIVLRGNIQSSKEVACEMEIVTYVCMTCSDLRLCSESSPFIIHILRQGNIPLKVTAGQLSEKKSAFNSYGYKQSMWIKQTVKCGEYPTASKGLLLL